VATSSAAAATAASTAPASTAAAAASTAAASTADAAALLLRTCWLDDLCDEALFLSLPLNGGLVRLYLRQNVTGVHSIPLVLAPCCNVALREATEQPKASSEFRHTTGLKAVVAHAKHG
jgi:hypothetical protein